MTKTIQMRRARRAFLTGFVAMGAAVSCVTPGRLAEAGPLRDEAGSWQLQIVLPDRGGVEAPTFQHDGQTYLLGSHGERYVVRVQNRSDRRVEAVVSVDGVDVMDGKPADMVTKRGYVIPAWGSVDIDGWRLSVREAAAFRFASVGESYAAKTGSARNVGVIGVAIFPERVRERIVPQPMPYKRRSMNAEPPSVPSMADAREGAAPGSRSSSGAGVRDEAAPSSSPSSPTPSPTPSPSSARRPGLGTEFGEAVSSHVYQTSFDRADARHPAVVLGVRYDDRSGLLATGIDVDGWSEDDDVALRRTAQPFPTGCLRFARPPAGWQR